MASDVTSLEEELLLLPGRIRQRFGSSPDGVSAGYIAPGIVLAVACGVALLSSFSSFFVFAFGATCGALLLLAAQVRLVIFCCWRVGLMTAPLLACSHHHFCRLSKDACTYSQCRHPLGRPWRL